MKKMLVILGAALFVAVVHKSCKSKKDSRTTDSKTEQDEAFDFPLEWEVCNMR